MLDTNTVSRFIRRDSAVLIRRVNSTPVHQICISCVTEAELLYGLEKKPLATALRKAVLAFINTVEVVPWTSDTARAYAKLRAATELRGLTLGSLDLMIASHAVETGTTFVTHDRTLHRLRSWLTVEDWS